MNKPKKGSVTGTGKVLARMIHYGRLTLEACIKAKKSTNPKLDIYDINMSHYHLYGTQIPGFDNYV